ncbi:MAG: hypothetical protein QCI00_05995, partial [Candidatus Thermoplasmatota archaeon]|nr:hypothetical protein [Candidatus Thermoplasmatota archaeon]
VFLRMVFLFNSLSVFSLKSPLANQYNWDINRSFVHKLDTPIDISIENAIYQLIARFIEFDSLCWAKNKKHHKIWVIVWDESQCQGLKSQIYNLQWTEDQYISRCTVVVLIQGFADGNEEYYIFYDTAEKPITTYPDHSQYTDSYFRYELIPGYPLQSSNWTPSVGFGLCKKMK